MALTIFPYPLPGGTPQQVPAPSSSFLIPAGTNDVAVFVTAPATLFGASEFGLAYSLDISTDGGATYFAARAGKIEAGRGDGAVPGHAADLPPGEIPTGLSNFAWEREQSASLGINETIRVAPGATQTVRLDSGTVRARLTITPLEGNELGPNVMVAGLAECYDLAGNVVPIDPASLQ